MKKSYIKAVLLILLVALTSKVWVLNGPSTATTFLLCEIMAIVNFFIIIVSVYDNNTTEKVIKYVIFLGLFAALYFTTKVMITNSYILYVGSALICFLNSKGIYNSHIKFIFINLGLMLLLFGIVRVIGFDDSILSTMNWGAIIYCIINYIILIYFSTKNTVAENPKTLLIICIVFAVLIAVYYGISISRLLSLSGNIENSEKTISEIKKTDDVKAIKEMINKVTDNGKNIVNKALAEEKLQSRDLLVGYKTLDYSHKQLLTIVYSFKDTTDKEFKKNDFKTQVLNIAEMLKIVREEMVNKLIIIDTVTLFSNLVCISLVYVLLSGKKERSIY